MSSIRPAAALVGSLLATLTFGLLVGVPSPAVAVPTNAGALDPSFSPNAPAGVTDTVATRQFVDVAVQQDGKIVAVSDQSDDFFVARFNPDGSPDTTFSLAGTGSATIDVGAAGAIDQALAVAVDAQNRIVVVGRGGAAVSDFALVRLSPDGKVVQLNTHVHLGNAADPSVPRDVDFQSDGTIVVAGSAKVGADVDFGWVRLSGATGAVLGSVHTNSFSAGDDIGRAVAVYPSGPQHDKIVVAGAVGTAGNQALGVIQLTPPGDVDMMFNGGKRVIDPTTGNDGASGVAITASGSVVVAGANGAADPDLVVTQLLPDGGFDGSFNLGAVRTIPKAGVDAVRDHPLALQPDGKIVLVGDTAGALDVGVFRLNPDGTTDTSFGAGGDATFNVSGNDDANAVAIDNSGNILVAGDEGISAGFLARLYGSPDSDGDGVRDPLDACPAVPGTLPNGCPPKPEALLKGKKVLLDTVLAKKKASATCPAKATVVVKTKARTGRVKVTKQLKTTAVTGGCRVTGKVNLHAKPKKTAKVKVTVSGAKLTTKHLTAVRP